MSRVDACPNNLTQVIDATNRLKCGNDEFGNSNYICLPKSDKTSLVEFCYKGIMGLQQKGNCLQAVNENLTLSSCEKFSSGCPDTHFRSSEFYKYPACQNIDWIHHCYLSDPSCPPNSNKNASENANDNWVLYGLCGFLVLAIIVAIIVVVCFRFRKHRSHSRGEQCDSSSFELAAGQQLEKEKEQLLRDITDEMAVSSTRNYVWVAAIDFGTTFSSYAFGRRDDLNENPTSASAPIWLTAGGGLASSKTPTTVLLDENEEFVDFGFAAENTYAELAENNKHHNYFYFRRFKMILFDKKVTTDTTISDIRGRTVKALKVFTHAIRYLKEHLFTSLEYRKSIVKDEEILWVLTVPSIWDDKAKLFMRKSAEEAGIPGIQLKIALEAEAASIYCQHIPFWKMEGSNSFSVFQPGSKYLVLDAGGGTVDITVHEVESNGHLKELHCASGGVWGGTNVDITFEKALAEIVTEDIMNKFFCKYTSDHIDWSRDFEIKKRNCVLECENDLKSSITLRVPFSFVEECLKTLGTDLTTLTNKSRFKDRFIWKSDKLKIDMSTFGEFFRPTCNKIVEHLEHMLKLSRFKDVKNILMVGGFSESRFLQDAIKEAFPDCRVTVPSEPSLAVLRGAVLFGHKPEVIESRIAKYTYAVRINDIKEIESMIEVIDGVDDSKVEFVRLVQKGDELEIDKVKSLTLKQGQTSFDICTLNEGETQYENIGKFVISMPINENDRLKTVKIFLDKTELTVKTGNDTPGVFQLPEDEKEKQTK